MNNNEYKLFDEYSKISEIEKQQFASTLDSTAQVKSNYHKVIYDYSWVDIMEDTLHYIDNILRNPKRFIINEEEIVKIEKSKKVTVESVIHLSQHTNLIQDYNEESGEVKPSKILNILKEETLDTYENRFIYTLIINMMNFISLYGNVAKNGSSINSVKHLNYEGSAKKGEEKINIAINLSATQSTSLDKPTNGLSMEQRIENLRNRITDFTGSDLYKDLARAHVAIVRSPIKKTNVILKNPNFQRAEALWNFMERYDKDAKKETKYNRSITDNQELKSKLDLAFLIDYSMLDKLSNNTPEENDWEEIYYNMLKRSIKNYLLYDPNMTENAFINVVKKEYKATKREQSNRLNEIKRILERSLNDYYKQTDKALGILK